MDEASGDASRAAIQIFVTAPHGEVWVPIMQAERHISHSVCEIKSDDASLAMAGPCDFLQVEGLARGVVHAAQKNQRDRIALAVNQRVDILLAKARFSAPRSKFQQRRCGIKSLKANLRLDRILIGRKSTALDQNLVALRG